MAADMRDTNIMEMVNKAIRSRNVTLAFQPIVQSRRSDAVAFHEGLLRVMDPGGRVIPAKDFIETVESQETGRLLDCMALDLGLQELAAEPSLRLSINMSARSIGYRKWSEVLENGLRDNPTLGERLILEITESSAMVMPEIVVAFMKDLQSKGISFAMDDFGAGFTSFRYLKDFYFDVLKVDGMFCKGVHRNPDNQVIIQALVSIAKHFDMFTVCESVETAEEAEYLARAGVDCLQGYYFGAPTIRPPWRPMPPESLSA
ncbi:MAG: EAL domain-containing protein [Mangrovicoccus sp.]